MENNKQLKYKPQQWKDLSIRERHSLIGAALAFGAGWLFAGVGLFTPPVGEISSSVIAILSESLIFAGAVWGITQYMAIHAAQLRNDMFETLQEMNRIKEEIDNNGKEGR